MTPAPESVLPETPSTGRQTVDAEGLWHDAGVAAAVFAVDPWGVGGVRLRAFAGPVRDRWLTGLTTLLDQPPRRIPLSIGDNRLLGGLDLAATLRSGRPVAERGILAECDGGVAMLAMAERVGRDTAARLAMVSDSGEVQVQRDGLERRHPARFGLLLLDEGAEDAEQPVPALLERCAFHLDLAPVSLSASRTEAGFTSAEVQAARRRLPHVQLPDAQRDELAALSVALGVPSCRTLVLAMRVARCAAALAERDAVDAAMVELAVRLVFLPVATRWPESPGDPPEKPEPSPSEADPEDARPEQPPEQQPSNGAEGDPGPAQPAEPAADRIDEAVQALLPEGLLERLRLQSPGLRRGKRAAGQGGPPQSSGARGRPAGIRAGLPRPGERLNVVETLRAAAPWQRLRREERAADPVDPERIRVHPEDFRLLRQVQRTETTTIFVVDASGSSASARLAEAKGAVELLLADCYVRRDRVALVAFRGARAQRLLPPTRSLLRAKRSLSGLPGGGGTPLADGIDQGRLLAEEVERQGGVAVLVFLTDGRANVDRAGIGGRRQALDDARRSARTVAERGIQALVLDTSARPGEPARALAAAMGARYLPLPYANAGAIDAAVRASLAAGPGQARSP